VFFSYIGFDSVSTLAGEVKKPSRDLPLGIIGTLVIATSLYVAISVVLLGMVFPFLLSPQGSSRQSINELVFNQKRVKNLKNHWLKTSFQLPPKKQVFRL
jgi:amino acid transporter